MEWIFQKSGEQVLHFEQNMLAIKKNVLGFMRMEMVACQRKKCDFYTITIWNGWRPEKMEKSIGKGCKREGRGDKGGRLKQIEKANLIKAPNKREDESSFFSTRTKSPEEAGHSPICSKRPKELTTERKQKRHSSTKAASYVFLWKLARPVKRSLVIMNELKFTPFSSWFKGSMLIGRAWCATKKKERKKKLKDEKKWMRANLVGQRIW